MKKIFAIALALVMVFSMASAFAYVDCDVKDYSWNCAAKVSDCGKAKVDVVPYVKVPVACAPYFEFQVSECAAAAADEFVYVAYMLTVDANPLDAWFENASFEVELTELMDWDGAAWFESDGYDLTDADAGIDKDADKEVTYYLDPVTFAWVEYDADEVDVEDMIHAYLAINPYKAKVCASFTSEFEALIAAVELDGYDVVTNLATSTDGLQGTITITKDGEGVEYTVVDGVVDAVAKVGGADTALVDKINATFGLGCGFVCVEADSVQKNFGWDDTGDAFEDCFKWGTASAIVDANCVVSIPKTGDVSVVAYAVMAVVAAAGAMLKK